MTYSCGNDICLFFLFALAIWNYLINIDRDKFIILIKFCLNNTYTQTEREEKKFANLLYTNTSKKSAYT